MPKKIHETPIERILSANKFCKTVFRVRAMQDIDFQITHAALQ